jgi:hypothetical protein
VRKAVKGWLVWDEETDRLAVVDSYQAVNLSAETAYRFAERLNRLPGEGRRSPPEHLK